MTDEPQTYDEAVERVHRAFCDPNHELVGPWDQEMAAALKRNGYVISRAESPDSGDGAGIDAALLAEALPDALSAMTEGDDETPAPQPSDEPGSPYVVGLARALAARLRSGSPAPEGGE